MASGAAIELNNVTFAYRLEGLATTILHDVTMQIGAGEMVAIQGPSGSGKSTLLHITGCLLGVGEGRVKLFGRDIARLKDDARAAVRNQVIGFVFQHFFLVPRMSVLENIMLPAAYLRRPPIPKQLRAKAIALAERLGLGQHLEHMPNQLSGGQQQRVAIARALINDAPLILADEPTGNLDSRAAAGIIELLQELHQEGRTVVVITHSAEVANACGRVIHIRDGLVVAGAPATIRANEHSVPRPSESTRVAVGGLLGARAHLAALSNLKRNKARSALTMLGVTIGIASVLAMLTIGSFTRSRILETYEVMGVNKVVLRGWPNWRRKATDAVSVTFRGFHDEKDLLPLSKVFPQIEVFSPVAQTWGTRVRVGGREADQVQVVGVRAEYFRISNRHLVTGRFFTSIHDDNLSAVCVIGDKISEKLFRGASPLNQVVQLVTDWSQVPCRVIGVMAHQSSPSEWASITTGLPSVPSSR